MFILGTRNKLCRLEIRKNRNYWFIFGIKITVQLFSKYALRSRHSKCSFKICKHLLQKHWMCMDVASIRFRKMSAAISLKSWPFYWKIFADPPLVMHNILTCWICWINSDVPWIILFLWGTEWCSVPSPRGPSQLCLHLYTWPTFFWLLMCRSNRRKSSGSGFLFFI